MPHPVMMTTTIALENLRRKNPELIEKFVRWCHTGEPLDERPQDEFSDEELQRLLGLSLIDFGGDQPIGTYDSDIVGVDDDSFLYIRALTAVSGDGSVTMS